MRIFPVAFIVVGLLGVAKSLDLIPIGMFHLIGPLLLIALGVALLFGRSRGCHSAWRNQRGDKNAPPPSAGRF